jgi:hypothetical protein
VLKPQDLSGKKFGRWAVIGYAGRRERARDSLWHCQCECGKSGIVSRSALRHGLSKSCGCLRTECTTARTRIDIAGQRFGRLTVRCGFAVAIAEPRKK